jgi:hypothetical protein
VDPSPHAYYVVEVTTRPELFDRTTHYSELTADNFYGSWSESPVLQSSPTYILPTAVWDRLRVAERLWYRVGSSASATSYVDYVVSTLDDQGDEALSIKILPGTGAPPLAAQMARRTISELLGQPSNSEDRLLIEGPLIWDRRLGPPTFLIEPGSATAYLVEVCSDPKYFDTSILPDELPKDASFSSGWIEQGGESDIPRIGFLAYVLPLETWKALLCKIRLYYRLVILNQGTLASPVNAMYIIGDEHRRDDRAVTHDQLPCDD